MNISIAYSTCPNDTYIFDAIANNRIDLKNINFNTFLSDVEILNKKALNQEFDISKISYGVYPYIADNYELLEYGSALGFNNGPLIISKKQIDINDISKIKIAIPGKHTTANLLMSFLFPKATDKVEYLFSDIENAVLNDEVDAGLVIHETRFTYKEKHLLKIADLGELWQEKTNMPIPLGGIVMKRILPLELKQKIRRVIKNSVRFAFENPEKSIGYIKQHAQETSNEVIKKHINLYVNNYTLSLGENGKKAIELLYKTVQKNNLIPKITNNIFKAYE